MEIFGKHIFGSDAQEWLKLCKEEKKAWILKYTIQSDEALISEFINNPKISKDCHCMDCGKNKKANESSGVSKTVTAIIKPANSTGNSGKNSTKRQKGAKK